MPRTIGPYRIDGILGRGAMGVVYRAAHVETGVAVALKTITCASDADLSGLRREIHALARIHHRGVVSILDQGIEADTPWFAMELIEGQTLRDYFRELWRSVSPGAPAGAGRLAECLAIVGSICEPLAFIHGRGLVHGDLKPANVHLADGGRAVLADFGLVSHFGTASGREVLEVGGTIRGTAPYMAPEVIRGEMIDARADLYALGCMLYEGVAGRLPFIAPTPRELFYQHLRDEPVPPSERVAGVPRELDELVLDLLAKTTHSRLGYAELVKERLADLGVALAADDGGRPEPYLYRAGLAGRGEALERFGALVDRALEGHGGIAFVGGESGIGKTRLVMEAATAAAEKGMRVVPAECSPDGAPLQAFRPALVALADRCAELGDASDARSLGEGAGVLAAYEPTLARLAARSGISPPAPLSAEAERERLQKALLDSLSTLARANKPLLLVLDDLQWADELSLHVLAGLQRRGLGNLPILLVATYRSEDTTRGLRALLDASDATTIRLGGLEASSMAEIVGDMLALTEAPVALAEHLFSRTQGSPFFVVEFLRLAVGERLLVRDRRGAWRIEGENAAIRLPESLRELVTRRMALLSPRGRDLATRASVLGNAFREELLMAVAEGDDADAMDAVQNLLARHVLEHDRDVTLRFTHAKIREIVADSIPTELRPELHRRAALALEELHRDEAELAVVYGRLAHHWELAGEPAKMLGYLEKAGLHALRTSAHEDALRYFGRALEAPLDAATESLRAVRRAEWEGRLSEALFGLGDLEASGAHALASLAAAGERMPESTAGWMALLAREAARQLVRRLLPARAVGDPETRARYEIIAHASSRLFYLYYFMHQPLPMTTITLLTVNAAERAGGALPVGRSYAQLGSVWSFARLDRAALRTFSHARDVARRTGDVVAGNVAAIHESIHFIHQGKWADAEPLAVGALERLRELGDVQEAEIAETLVGQIEYYSGRFRESAARFARMEERARARGNFQHEAWGLYLSARAQLRLGEHAAALELFMRAREMLRDHPDETSRFVIEGFLALGLFETGERARAERIALEALASVRRGVPLVFSKYEGFATSAEVCARSALEKGADPARFSAALELARAELASMTRVYPLARPAAELTAALAAHIRGSPRRAARRLRRSIAAAATLPIPYEEARARLWMMHLGLGSSEERREHASRARDLFERLGCLPPPGFDLDRFATPR